MLNPIGYKQLTTKPVIKRIPTGIFDIDHKAGGIRHDDFIIVAGDSGTGKSYLTLYMACNIAKTGHKVMYIDLENGEAALSERMINFGFNLTQDFGMPNEKYGFERLYIFDSNELYKNPLDVIENSIVFIKPALIVVDTFDNLILGTEPRLIPQTTMQLAIGLHRMAIKHSCAILILQQLNKDAAKFSRRPGLDDIKGGAGLIHKATKIFTLFRYGNMRIEKMMEDTEKQKFIKNIIELIPRKDRYNDLPGHIILLRQNCGVHSLLTKEQEIYMEIAFRGK